MEDGDPGGAFLESAIAETPKRRAGRVKLGDDPRRSFEVGHEQIAKGVRCQRFDVAEREEVQEGAGRIVFFDTCSRRLGDIEITAGVHRECIESFRQRQSDLFHHGPRRFECLHPDVEVFRTAPGACSEAVTDIDSATGDNRDRVAFRAELAGSVPYYTGGAFIGDIADLRAAASVLGSGDGGGLIGSPLLERSLRASTFVSA